MNLPRLRKDLKALVGTSNVSDDFYKVSKSCLDEVSRRVFALDKLAPFLVARPIRLEQVSQILKYASENRIPVFVRGSGTGYFGGEIPRESGIVLEMTGLSKIVSLDRVGGFVTCEAGITVASLNRFLKKHGLWWPHNPGSRNWATIGGSLSSLGVGTFSARYGYAPDTLLSMKIALPSGEVVKLGTKARHDMSSYNMLDLFTSAEGSLAIIGEATLKVFPLPKNRKILLFFFKKLETAVRACREIATSGICPETIEIEDRARFTLEGLAPLIELESPRVQKLKLEEVEAVLLTGFSGSRRVTEFGAKETAKICTDIGGKSIEDKAILNLYWKAKTQISSWKPRVKANTLKVHTCVPSIPFHNLPQFESKYMSLGKRHRELTLAGVGYYIALPNFECTASARVMFDESDPEALRAYEIFTREIAEEVVKMEGTPASTFGMGTILGDVIRDLVPRSQTVLAGRLKQALDPSGILCPGKKIRSPQSTFRSLRNASTLVEAR